MLTKETQTHGFQVTDIKDIPDSHGTLYEMTHIHTGAQLCWLDRQDENMTFAISFKTIPADDTGVFHILEHSVLNGSDKYPVKEPFVELLKSSMNTFLNAMTFSDKTMFPVSSRNKKDFMNLVSIYMDAVLHPAIYHNPHIFQQEGWHYELRDAKDETSYKGVVFSEMKGAAASVDDTIIDAVCRALYPDNCYRFNSGGDPSAITDLTYENFLAAHRYFYHPSNAKIWLDGNIDLDAVLTLLDDAFAGYEKKEILTDIPHQKVLPAHVTKYAYELSPEENTESHTMIAFAKIMMDYDDVEKNAAVNVIDSVLTGSNDAPLKKALLQAGLCEDLEFALIDAIQQPFCICLMRNTDEDKYEEIRRVIRETIQDLVKNGLDKEELTATLNQMEFNYLERSEPAGILNAEDAMEAWLYDGDPSMFLDMRKVYQKLHTLVETDYFEKIMADFFLDEEHLQTIIAVPSHTLGTERIQEEKEKLTKIRASWTKEEEAEIIAQNHSLDTWQAEPDSSEALSTLPKLTLDDVTVEPKKDNLQIEEYRHVTKLIHPSQDSDIVYMNLYFSLAGVPLDMVPSVSFFPSLLTNVPTKQHSVQELKRMIKKYIGRLSFSVLSIAASNETDKTLPMLTVRCALLQQNVEKAKDIILEIIQESVFSKETVLPVVKQTLVLSKMNLTENGNYFAMTRANAHFNADWTFREYADGYEKLKWLMQSEKDTDAFMDLLLNDCMLYQENLFLGSRMTGSITNPENSHILDEIVDSLPMGDANFAKVHYPLLPDRNEAIVIPGTVGYIAASGPFGQYDPQLTVASHILTYDWMWTEVRVKGGAYGINVRQLSDGLITTASYRDPDLNNTLRAFRDIPSYLQNLKDDMPMDQYVIGALAASTPLLSPASKISVADSRYFSHTTLEERRYNRTKMHDMTLDDLKALSPQIQHAIDNMVICAAAPQAMIDTLQEEDITIISEH